MESDRGDSEQPAQNQKKQQAVKFYEKIFGKYIGPSYTLNMRINLRNMFVFKSIYCNHKKSCYEHMKAGIITRFMKGFFLQLSLKYILFFLQNIDQERKRGIQGILQILKSSIYDI